MQAVNIHKRFIISALGSVKAWALNGLKIATSTLAEVSIQDAFVPEHSITTSFHSE
jgi:hypothetical protein